MVLSWEEIREELERIHYLTPQDFERSMAEYMPQTILDQLMDELDMRWEEQFGRELAGMMVAVHLMGMHTGWFLAMKALQDST